MNHDDPAAVIFDTCWKAAFDATSFEFSIRGIGSVAADTHIPGYPIKLMVYNAATLTAAQPKDFDKVVAVVEKALRASYAVADARNYSIAPRVYLISLQLPIMEIYFHTESNEIKYTDCFIDNTTEDYPEATEFIVLMKSWAAKNGIMSFDYHHDGRIPETAIDILATSAFISGGDESRFDQFFKILLQVGNEPKRTFVPVDASFEPRTAELDDFIHVSYPYYICGNAAAGVCPNLWETKVVPAVQRAQGSICTKKRKSTTLETVRKALLGG